VLRAGYVDIGDEIRPSEQPEGEGAPPGSVVQPRSRSRNRHESCCTGVQLRLPICVSPARRLNMTSHTIESGTLRQKPAEGYNPVKACPGILAGSLQAAFGLASACNHSAALATMSERDLDDLGLLPWEVRSEF
jgi:hypothetical protein